MAVVHGHLFSKLIPEIIQQEIASYLDGKGIASIAQVNRVGRQIGHKMPPLLGQHTCKEIMQLQSFGLPQDKVDELTRKCRHLTQIRFYSDLRLDIKAVFNASFLNTSIKEKEVAKASFPYLRSMIVHAINVRAITESHKCLVRNWF